MKPFEWTYLCSSRSCSFTSRGSQTSAGITRLRQCCGAVLDVGGRKTLYTIGVPAKITVTDLPRDEFVAASIISWVKSLVHQAPASKPFCSLAENVINTYQSAGKATKKLAQGTHHLVAMAEKRGA